MSGNTTLQLGRVMARLIYFIDGFGPRAQGIVAIFSLASAAVAGLLWLRVRLSPKSSHGVKPVLSMGDVSLYRLKDLQAGPLVRRILSNDLPYDISEQTGQITNGPFCPKCGATVTMDYKRDNAGYGGARGPRKWICRIGGHSGLYREPN